MANHVSIKSWITNCGRYLFPRNVPEAETKDMLVYSKMIYNEIITASPKKENRCTADNSYCTFDLLNSDLKNAKGEWQKDEE